jgi:uncharacterized protein (DUF2164 family)
MNRTGIKKTVWLLIMTGLITGMLYAYAAAQQKTTFIIYVRGNKKDLSGVDQRYVNVEEFFNYFGIQAESLDEGKSAKIGHLYYNKSIKSAGGKAYTDGATLLRFFGIPYTQANNWTFTLNTPTVPMFNRTLHRFNENVSVTIEHRTQVVDALNINNNIFLPLESMNEIIKNKHTLDARGRLTLDGKQIDRWINAKGKTYALVDDLRTALGKPVEVKF